VVSVARLVVAGTGSGVGKTTVATGLMAALRRRGLRVAGFKVGPDFIDPSYHALATGRPGRNLDAFLSGPELICALFAHGARDADVAVVEGVMGLFDGRSGGGELASTAQVAKLLRAPVVLVVDAAAMARSAAAVVHGFDRFDPDLDIAGVVLNRVASERHEASLREALAPLGIPVLGVLRRNDGLASPEGHLGLVPVAERRRVAARTVDGLGAALAAACDLEALLALARRAPALAVRAWDPRDAVGGGAPARTRVAVAGGPAFSFLYEENLELLAAAGAPPVAFDPLGDAALPPDAGALYLGGGFPERFALELSDNLPLRAAVAGFARSGRPVIAECGGLLYLGRELDGVPMCGVIGARGRMTDRLTLGYREAVAAAGSPLCPAGARVRAHEFHYSAIEPAASSPPAWALDPRPEGFAAGGIHASYLHTHWAASPMVADRLARAAAGRPLEAAA
jgi:cobyrinic acid a,c-diamide synthase